MKLGFISLFFISIFVIHLAVRPDEFASSAFWSSIALTLPALIYVLIRSPLGADQRPRGFYTNLSLPIAVLIFCLISFAVFSIDFNSFRIVRSVSREEDLFIRIINLHLVLFFFVCVYRYSNKWVYKNKGGLLLVLCLVLSLGIAYFEGRRTAAVIPIILIAVFSLTQGSPISKSLYRILFFCSAFVIVFAVITLIRSPDLSIEFIVKAILSRLFNPGYIILELMSQQDYQFSPDTISNSVQRIGYVFGISGYEGSTNEFGRYYGFISSSNFFVGINPGIVVESFLSFGWFYLIPIIIFFELSFAILHLYRKLLFGSDIFIAILVLHGMQMEIPYLVGLLFKIALLGLLLRLVEIYIPSRVR